MALTITDQVMRSTDTRHNACRLWTDANPAADVWAVSWLPGRRLTRIEANAAMLIADAVGRIPADAGPEAYGDSFWSHVDVLAAELGLAGPDAVTKASELPQS
jgi:hypothetical protein